MAYVKHDLSTVRKARMLEKAGWSYRKIGRALDVHGETVKRWCDPDYWEQVRARNRAAQARRATRAKKPPSDEFLLERAKSLYEAGLSYRSIAVLLAVDYDLDLNRKQIEWRVRNDTWGSCLGRPRINRLRVIREAA